MRSRYGEPVAERTSVGWYLKLITIRNDEKHFIVIMHKKVLFSLSSFTSFTLHSGKRCDRISFGGEHLSLIQGQSKTSVRQLGTEDRRRYGEQILRREGTGRSGGAS